MKCAGRGSRLARHFDFVLESAMLVMARLKRALVPASVLSRSADQVFIVFARKYELDSARE